MDDITGDVVADLADADGLAEWMDAVQGQTKLFGGIGVYDAFDAPDSPKTPCVQVDLRGWRERWRQAEYFAATVQYDHEAVEQLRVILNVTAASQREYFEAVMS